jgi:predicted ATPase/DNA-binding SARP family transcriptional activator
VEFRILGPLEVARSGRLLPLGGRRARSVLAVLVVFAGDTVPISTIVEEVWGDNPPRTAVDTLQSYLSRLRRMLDPSLPRGARSDLLVTHRSGYELAVPGDHIDARSFERRVARARAGRRADSLPRTADRFRAALGLWRGRALDDLEAGPLLRAEVERLTELRAAVLEERIEADLAAGRHAEVIGELQALVPLHPLRENLRALLMLALYRAGRQAEALDAFSDARGALVEELGVEPGRKLQRLQADILGQSPHLDGPSTPLAPDHGPRPHAGVVHVDAGNLPAPLDTFVGRAGERGSIAAQLGSSRLVTLTGAAGSGKSRLAVTVASDVAASFPGGAWLVRAGLAPGGEPVRALAAALGIPVEGGASTGAVTRRLQAAPTLLVLDDCDDVLERVAELTATLLARCRSLRILVTSRRPLGVAGEGVRLIRPLPLPPAGASDRDVVAASPAGALFCDRARSSQPEFVLDGRSATDVARVCHAVDGLPLAIEAAARHLRLLSVRELADRVEDSLTLLGAGGGGADPRQQLAGAVARSYRRLAPPEKLLLGRLSVFPGSFTVDAAETVCARTPSEADTLLPALRGLIDSSLVEPGSFGNGPARHHLLSSTRSFAAKGLGEGDAAELAERHAAFYADIAQQARHHLTGPGKLPWLDRLEGEHGNLLAALEWTLRSGAGANSLSLAGAVWWFWMRRGRAAEGYRWLFETLDAVGGDAPATLRQDALSATGAIAAMRAEWRQPGRGLALASGTGSRACVAGPGHGEEAGASHRLSVLSFALWSDLLCGPERGAFVYRLGA